MANTVINTPELLNLDSTTGATVLAKGTISQRPPRLLNVDYLVVAGGGGGGGTTSDAPGGGGAGGLITSYGNSSGGGTSPGSAFSLLISTNYTVTVGQGGNGGAGKNPGTDGVNSVFNTITSTGGGGGGTSEDTVAEDTGRTGGSAGGSGTGLSSAERPSTPAVSNPVQGYAGGASITSSGKRGGGGGGAGESGNTNSQGYGGDGLEVSITGSAIFYAGGGGGGYFGSTSSVPGGSGGGGDCPSGSNGNGGDGTDNTGGGGGAAKRSAGGGSRNGGNGGDGVVILRYPNNYTINVGAGLTSSTTPDGLDKVTTFTQGTGTISFSGTTVTNQNNAINGTLRFNTDTNKTEYFDGTGWYEIVDEYASGFIGPGTNYFDTKLYTGNGTTQSIGGYINGSASFNGSSSKIITGLDLTSFNSASLSVWIYWEGGDFNPIFGGNNTVGGTTTINRFTTAIANSGGRLDYVSKRGDFFRSSNMSLFNTNAWNHIVITDDFTSSSTASKVYVNGTQDANFARVATSYGGAANTNLYIGQGRTNNNGQAYLTGLIDQVRIYNVELSSSDVAALNLETAATATTAAFPSGQTAVATYTMDTSANGLLNTQDLSTVNYPAGASCLALYEMNGNSNDTSGTYNGTPTNITYQGGAFDQAAVFNGSSSRIQVASTATAPLNVSSGNFSISMWVNPSNLTNNNKLIYKFGTSASLRSWLATITTNGVLYVVEGTTAGDTLMLGTATIPTNTWTHIAITRAQGGNLVQYINGVATDTFSTQNRSLKTSTEPLYIGYQAGQTTNFTGLIDQVRIFNTALTQAQVTTLARGVATSYSGTATNVNFNGHLDFAPDLVWVKNRDESSYHYLYNTVSQGNLYSDSPAAQDANSVASYGTISPTSNGFGVTRGSNSSSNGLNKNSNDYVSWSWKAGGTAAAGTGTGVTNVSVSVNKDSGFSIVKYTGGNGASDTVNHGLTDAEMIILKDLTDGTNQWRVWHKDLTSGYWLYLNLANAQANAAVDGGIRNVDSNSFGFINGTTGGVEAVNSSASNYIAYVWKSISGYSKIGTYEGLGTSTVTVSDVGFKPSFIMIKNIDATANWNMYDLKRSTVANRANKILYPNLSNSEPSATNYYFDMNDSGFVVSATNHEQINFANRTYIYMTFA